MKNVKRSADERLLEAEQMPNFTCSYLFMNCCASVSSLWGSVSTAIGCSTTSRFLMRMQFQVGMKRKGVHHRRVARIPAKKSTTSVRRLISRRPHRPTNT